MNDWAFGDLKTFGYSCIVADPPWVFKTYSNKGVTTKGAGGHYKLMSLDAIKALPVGQLARRDCLMLMWTTGWAIATGQAQDVMRAWGFTPVTELVWAKMTVNGKYRMGTGYRSRSKHEPILLGVMGKPAHKAFHSLIPGLAREHSRKPDEVYEHIRQQTPNMFRCDLFSRFDHEGFDCWGDEAGKFNPRAATKARVKKKLAAKRKVRSRQTEMFAPVKRRRWGTQQAAV